ncbi:methylated-DNA--[protein]-cysteine S-methyltransferase [Rosettibacter firmus]|uniref:methylated-DNA--[protein]-cysteine S-methyltransferase n=1 Tax=Rosettibacter firmus TaxID=3111522 RepID=UPI00336BF5C6
MINKYLAYYESPIGTIRITADDDSITTLHFMIEMDGVELEPINMNETLEKCIEQLDLYFKGELREFDLKLNPSGTDFQKKVWNEILKIPYGKTRSYLDLSRLLGNEKSIRAIARANGENKIAIIIPCHRVIGSDKSLTGYTWGLWRKKWLLNHEAAVVSNECQLSLF